jgi:cytochrome c peroxidase
MTHPHHPAADTCCQRAPVPRRGAALLAIAAFAVAGVLAACGGDDGPAEDPSEAGLSSMERLGKRLFEDTSLSEPAGQSCATCHAASVAFADPDASLPTSKGVRAGLVGNRNTPMAAYAMFAPEFHYDGAEGLYVGGQFLDGRAATLEAQAQQPFLNPVEMANPNRAAVVEKVRNGTHALLFREVFGSAAFDDVDAAYRRIAQAIAAFERTRAFAPFSSKFDHVVKGLATLTAQEQRGLELFNAENKGNCAACHPSTPIDGRTPALFTDFTYDNLGVPRNPDNRFYTLGTAFNPAGPNFVDLGLGGRGDLATDPRAEHGKFKVPSLRNVAVTGPYMHNGYFRDLKAVVQFYNDRDLRPQCANSMWTREAEAQAQGCWPSPEVAANVNVDELGRLGLSDAEVDDIVAFLRTLTDGYVPPGR